MTTTAFDTLKFTEQLIAAGCPERQAKETIRAIQAARESSYPEYQVNIKRDIAESENRLEYKIELLRAETSKNSELVRKDIEILRAETKKDIETIRKEIAESKNQLIRWMGGFAVIGASYVTWLFEFHGKV